MRGLNSNSRYSIITVVVLFSLFMMQSLVLAKSKVIIAKIKDNKGVIDTVKNLKANYTAGGMWMGNRPERTTGSMVFVYFEKDGRTTYENKIEISFSKMTSLKYIPKEKKKYLQKYIIKKKDGLTIIIDNKSYVEKDKTGKLIKSITINGYSQKTGESQGQSITLNGLKGTVEKDGRKGKYFIPISEVREIIFE